ncbi:hypothetical protein [Adhaeretor mobilis]|uniref:Uncharacterized protein n=1 Tax=Adhaeretor mobilis TaxID=1930276 RepID=A0A517MPH1_9BACT|nr:hypothetical protein [Adhaeretor mobilis]QDS96762.1 hypothetical protein HG15A2_00200 [Adhaeretor mobilis]
MSRDSQQLERLVREFLRLTKGRVGTRWLVVLGVLGVAYLVAAPMLNERMGWNLPVIAAEQTATQSDRGEQGTSQSDSQSSSSSQTQRPSTTKGGTVDPAELDHILVSDSNRVYTSPAGIRYTRGSAHGHRLKHLMAHASDQPGRDGSHGVFDANEPAAVVELIDQAYMQALSGQSTKTTHEANGTKYEVSMGRRIGYVGGKSGARRRPPHPAARKLRMILDGDRFITAFPFD